VDPDNRRPVDYGLRTGLLAEVCAALARDRPGATAAMLEGWHDGRLKLALTAALLAHRREHPALYAEGAYEPVAVSGPKADQLCAFARGHGADALLVVAARFPARLEAEPSSGDTKLAWPQAAAGATHWRDLLSGRVVERRGEAVAAGALFGEQPVAVLAPESSGRS